MAKIYVPIISENSELYKVETVENDNSFSINGIAKGSPKYNKVEELVNKLRPFTENKFLKNIKQLIFYNILRQMSSFLSSFSQKIILHLCYNV